MGFGAVLAAGIAFLVLAAPLTSAITPTKLKAPYSGSASGNEGAVTSGCGGTALFSKGPAFNLTTGRLLASSTASQTSCGGGTVFVDMDQYGGLETLPLSISSSHSSIKETWKVSFKASLTVTLGGPNGFGSAYYEVYPWGYVDDLTNGSALGSSNYQSITHTIMTGSYVHTFSGVYLSTWINGTFATGHSYVIFANFEIELESSTGPGSSVIVSSVDSNAPAYRASLQSITIS